MSPSKNIIAFFIACVAFIAVATVLKMTQMPFELARPPVYGLSDHLDSPAQDDSFLAPPAASSTSSVISTPVATKPAKPAVPADSVSAEAYLVGNVATGEIYLQKNAMAVLPFASMSKLITAFAATDLYASGTPVTVSEAATKVPPDASALKAGETFTLNELLYPMLLNSSNVAAEAIASSKDRTYFLEQMLGYAWEVGMPNSYFADPTGVSPKNAGTADGFFALAQYLYSKRPDILAITRVASLEVSTTSEHGAHRFTNIHPFVGDPRFLGGKTGRTPEALETMITIMNIQDHPIAIIILRSSQGRAKDTQLLIDRVQKSL